MKAKTKWTMLAVAVTAVVAAGAAHAETEVNKNINIDVNKTINNTVNNTVDNTVTSNVEHNSTSNAESNYSSNAESNFSSNVEKNYSSNVEDNFSSNVDLNLSKNVDVNYSENTSINQEVNNSSTVTLNKLVDISYRTEYEDIQKTENVQSDIRREKNEHGVSVNLEKDLRLSSDIRFTGEPTITGNIDLDSAAIAIIDNRQSVTDNFGYNEKLTNDASIGEDVGSNASGNLGFNVAAGDNNVQDNAAALSAADASFAFGLADAEIFVNQYGAGNLTLNKGVTNDASISGNAFSNASGNISVNIAAGNNNQQKNALAASVATSAYAQASVSSNQVSTGNTVSNHGTVERLTETTQVSLSGPVSGWSLGVGVGAYEGSTQGEYAGSGNAYQQSNFYADMWQGELHPAGPVIGHADYDIDSQGAVANPYRPGVGGFAFDTDESGSYAGSESGELGFVELSYSELWASLSGTVATARYIVHDATNTASLSGSAFSNASGNIGVNVAAGTGNLQANSLALAVAQPSTGGGNGGGGPGE